MPRLCGDRSVWEVAMDFGNTLGIARQQVGKAADGGMVAEERTASAVLSAVLGPDT